MDHKQFTYRSVIIDLKPVRGVLFGPEGKLSQWMDGCVQRSNLCSGPLGVMVSGRKSTSGAQHPPFRGMGRG